MSGIQKRRRNATTHGRGTCPHESSMPCEFFASSQIRSRRYLRERASNEEEGLSQNEDVGDDDEEEGEGGAPSTAQ